jgi:hypothetical protein
MERKYSVSEIDRMRAALDFQYLWGCRQSEHTFFNGTSSGGTRVSSRPYKEEDMRKDTEQRLRTYMLAGIEPEELE